MISGENSGRGTQHRNKQHSTGGEGEQEQEHEIKGHLYKVHFEFHLEATGSHGQV